MEIYILDGLLRRNHVVDKFDSLIWTERWNQLGDFQLDLVSNLENRTLFQTGTQLAQNNSYRVMSVETVEEGTSGDGQTTLQVKGRSLESILQDRVFKQTLSNQATAILTGSPANVAREMFDHICRPPAGLSFKDLIPFLMPGTIFAPGTILESTAPINWEQATDSLYNGIQKLCELYDLGFRLVRNFDTSQLYFDIYTGSDRTTKQTTVSPVVFSVGLDNIQNTTEFTSIQESKNVAYVFSDVGYAIVYAEDVDPDIAGFERRVLVVNASVDPNALDINAELVQAGNEALLDKRGVSIFDGEINQYNEYTYGIDYDLGDLVEMRNKDGVITYKRVTEQIFVSDANGERSYPTLAFNEFAGTNTWASWNYRNLIWEEFTTEFWTDM